MYKLKFLQGGGVSHMQYIKIVQMEWKQDLYIMTESHMH